MVPSFDPALVRGVASYALEFLGAVAGLGTVYVPIGLGSGICRHDRGARGARARHQNRRRGGGERAGLRCFRLRRAALSRPRSADTIADGVACRVPLEAAVG